MIRMRVRAREPHPSCFQMVWKKEARFFALELCCEDRLHSGIRARAEGIN